MKIIISLSTFAIITVLFSFTTKYQNHSKQQYLSYQKVENDTIKAKLTQKLKSITDDTDRQKIKELIMLNDTITNIKPDYSNTNLTTLKSYKKQLADNTPNYKRLEIMEAFKFNFKKVAKYIRNIEMLVVNQRVEKARQELILARCNAQKQTGFTKASVAYQKLLKQEQITQKDVDNYKANYPEYSKQKPKKEEKTWLELLQQLVH